MSRITVIAETIIKDRALAQLNIIPKNEETVWVKKSILLDEVEEFEEYEQTFTIVRFFSGEEILIDETFDSFESRVSEIESMIRIVDLEETDNEEINRKIKNS